MARDLRVEFEGAIYHVTCRMVGSWQSEENRLFKDERDCDRFLQQLAERTEQYSIRLYLFVCMTNHFHLVFETPQGNCSRFMHSLCTAYTVYYNLRHRRHGHLFDGRFKAKLVEGDDYLLSLSRYVHLNPVQVAGWSTKPMAERIRALRSYRWSSYPSYIGRRKALEFVEYAPLLAEVGGKQGERPKRYGEFVEAGLAESDEEFQEVLRFSPRSIGGEVFRAWVDGLYHEKAVAHSRPEDVSFRHVASHLSPEAVLNVLSEVFSVEGAEFKRRRRDSPLRAVAARLLIRYAGLSQRDVADLLHIGSGSAVSKQLSGLPAKEAKDRHLRRQIKAAEARLREMGKEVGQSYP